MNLRRWTALLLAAVMALSLLPTALAVDNGDSKSPGNCPSEDAKYRNNGHHMYYAEVDEPWCITSGTCWWQCVYCGDEYEEYLPPLGHDFRDDWQTMYDATCTSGGQEIRFCHRCQQEEIRTTPPLGHNWLEDTIRRVEPTCTEDGYREYIRVCSRCGLYDGATPVAGSVPTMREILPALGHDWGAWKEDEPGDCTNQGLEKRTCRRCGIQEWRYTGYGDHD